MNFFNQRLEETKEQPGFLVNSIRGTEPVLLLHNPEYLKEYFTKEIQYTIKYSQIGTSHNAFGFFFMNGPRFQKQRVIFSEIFKVENITKFVPKIHEILESDFEKIKKTHMKNGEAYTADYRQVRIPFFNLLVPQGSI